MEGEDLDNMVVHVISARPEVAGHQLGLSRDSHHCQWDQQTQGRDIVNAFLVAFFWFIRQLLCFACSQVLSDDRETHCDGLEWSALGRTS